MINLTGILVGGYGGGISLEVVEASDHCLGEDSDPELPVAPSGTIEGWSAEYVDDKLFLCGGSNINSVSDCYSLTIGSSFWEYVSMIFGARGWTFNLLN